MHGFDGLTPVEETLSTLDTLVRSGKVRYVGYSNFSGWHAMKSLSAADRRGWPRYVAQQIYYSLIGRDAEHELVPLALDQGVGSIVWSPLGWGRLTGKFKRGQPPDAGSRLKETAHIAQQKSDDYIFSVLDALETVASQTASSVPQVAISWLLRRPTVNSVVIGARNEHQLVDNLGASDLRLTAEQLALLDAASAAPLPYPYSHQRRTLADRNPSPF
jgi:aryl-alcohol dehydrogenase-like predicted oxidoreductase